MSVAVCEKFSAPNHMVQFYGDERVLAKNVSHYLGEGLRKGAFAIVVATPAHRQAFIQELEEQGLEPTDAIREGHLILKDAGEILAGFMVAGQPDLKRFEATVGAEVRKLSAHAGEAGLRAYGEMVDLLWNAGHSAAAARLEELWNQLLVTHRFDLLCAYQIDVFGTDFQTGVLDGILSAHTHVVSAAFNEDLEGAVNGAIEQVLGSRAQEPKPLTQADLRPTWAAIPKAEAMVLWLRDNLPDYADEILTRARGFYQASLLASR